MEFFNPLGLQDYTAYFNTVLSISGVLFGLAFAVLLFIIQSGFSSFKYSRRMFLELYVRFGKNLLLSLAYLTVMPLLVLYFNQYWWAVNLGYVWFFIFYLKTTYSHQYQLGYIATLNSTKYIPENYGAIRSYIRTITNLGFIHNFIIFSISGFMLVYPIVISYFETQKASMTDKGIFYSSIFVMILTIVKIKNFIPEFFDISNQELDYKEEENKNTIVDYSIEFQAFEKYLKTHEILELDPLQARRFLDGKLWVRFLKDDRTEIWLNIHIDITDATNVEIRDEVCSYARKILHLFSSSKIDINTIVLSFHIKIVGDVKCSRNIFIRTSRLELTNINLETSSDSVQEIQKLENIIFDKLFRNI